MQKRLFTALTLPNDVKKRLFRIVEREYANLPVCWTKPENYHLTLNFLGFIQEEKILEICECVSGATKGVKTFEINFFSIEAGPGDREKLIWAVGSSNKELARLKNNLDGQFGFLARDRKEFTPHITLGRIKKEKWKKLAEAPKVKKEFLFSVPAASVELFESRFEKGRRVYYIMESFPLE